MILKYLAAQLDDCYSFITSNNNSECVLVWIKMFDKELISQGGVKVELKLRFSCNWGKPHFFIKSYVVGIYKNGLNELVPKNIYSMYNSG